MTPDLAAAVQRLILRDNSYQRFEPLPHWDHEAELDDLHLVVGALLPAGPKPDPVEFRDGDTAWAFNHVGVFKVVRKGMWGHVDFTWAEQMAYDLSKTPLKVFRTEAEARLARDWERLEGYLGERGR